MLTSLLKFIAGIILLSGSLTIKGQKPGIPEIEQALFQKDFDQADALLQPIIGNFIRQNKPDSLLNYLFLEGKVTQKRKDLQAGTKAVVSLREKIKKLTKDPGIIRQAYIEEGEFYGTNGMDHQGYKANLQAKKYALLMPGETKNFLGLIENNLSTYAQRIGDIDLAGKHSRAAIKMLTSAKNPNPETLYIAYNGMGATMWYASRSDSALYYYNKALETLAKTEPTPMNKYYRPATIQNNLSGLYSIEGNTTKAIITLNQSIANLRNFITSSGADPKKQTAIRFQFQAIDNLAGMHKEMGDLKKARELLEYSYQQKQQHLEAGDPAIFISEILLGQLYFAARDYGKSLLFLQRGLDKIASSPGDYMIWEAEAYSTMALLYETKKESEIATYYYEKTDSLYEESLQGSYDYIYLDFLRNTALFYAENHQPAKAIQKANKGYQYVSSTQGTQTLLAFYQLLNLAEVASISGNYRQALDYSSRGLRVLENNIHKSESRLDSIRMELKKPKAILQKGKATYALLTNKDEKSLSLLLDEMNLALSVLDRQKTILTDPEDIGFLVSDHSDLVEFIKKLNVELYNSTKNPNYIDRAVSMHEAGMYNRIRARLEKNDSIQFAHVSKNILQQEQLFKKEITRSLQGNSNSGSSIKPFQAALTKQEDFRESLKKEFPDYYNLRYASIFKSLEEIKSKIPAKTTLIRYLFIDKKLFVLVADKEKKTLHALNSDKVAEQIESILNNSSDVNSVSKILLSLYQSLWAPIAANIRYHKVIIIPDGYLFNLNFELLTPKPIRKYTDLARMSLLADYTISYHYSLFLFQQQEKNRKLQNSFIAFAPGFTDELKKDYRSVTTDSFEIDNNYLSLLPQPFSINLAEKTNSLLGGQVFIYGKSTKQFFKENAGGHQIIHIGTHAESNNDYPEFSRLIFAKNISNTDEDNSLYVDEIYNYNLTANLAVLTACETGKPGYQDGEGMISLAHAFNYAGSESILTGLWKIDEQASSVVLSFFYNNILRGMAKDEALRQAKLSYLSKAEGRMLAPQYWAGLVIMGDTSPIVMEKQKAPWWMIPGLVLMLGAGGYILWRRKKK